MKAPLPSHLSYLRPLFDAMAPPSGLPIAEWAEKNVYLPEKATSEPGRIRISRTPYVRGVYEAFQSLYVEEITLVWGRQLSKTTTIFCCIAYEIAEDPGPALFLMPAAKLGKYTSGARLTPILDKCQPVQAKATSNRYDKKKLEIIFQDSILSIEGAGSEANVMSRPVRYLFCDEVDTWRAAIGEGGSNPLESAKKTTQTFGNRKIVYTSTPSVPEGEIWSKLKEAAYVFELWVPCPECGGKQVLVWDQIKFPKDRDPETFEAWYECSHCHAKIENWRKGKMLDGGEWRARVSEDPCDDILKNAVVDIEQTISLSSIFRSARVKKIGFHLPGWYSPFAGGSFTDCALEFLAAVKSGDFQRMKDWTKFWAARPWLERVETKTYQEILGNKIALPPLVCPADTVVLTCAIDPGQGGFWFVVMAWQTSGSRHVVQYGFLESWAALDALCFGATYEVAGTGGGRLRIWRIGIDVGGSKYDQSHTMTDAAYDWIRRSGRSNVYGIRGAAEKIQGGKRLALVIADKMPGRGEAIPGGLAWWRVDTGQFKDSIQYHLGIPDGEPGRLTFHSETGEDLARHLLAEEKRRNEKGVLEWVVIRKMNHLLDCLVYDFALADPECQGGWRIIQPPVFPKVRRDPEEEKGKGWLDGIEALRR